MKISSVLLAALSCSLAKASQEQILLQAEDSKTRPLNVAIIGAGAAGSSSAWHLARFAANASLPVNITIFERNPYIGGRSTTVSVHNDPSLPAELGASIFVQVNKILVEAAKHFNLSTSSSRSDASNNIPGPALGVWDGEKILITQSGGWWDFAKLWWRYGRAPMKTMSLMKKTVNKFLKMYEEPVFPFESLTQAAQDVRLLAVTAATGEQYMRENLIAGPFGREIVQASTRVNYAQNLEFIHGLEAMVCMAAQGAMAIEGGNWRLFESMVEESGAKILLVTEVGGVWPQGGEEIGYALNYSHPDGSGSGSQIFDAVVLAAPYQFSGLKSLGADSDHRPNEIPYVELHVTLFTSPHLLSSQFFNLPSNQPAPQTILTTLPDGEPAKKGPVGVGSPGFFSISLLQSFDNPQTGEEEYLYKVFAPKPPDKGDLAKLLGVEHIEDGDITWMHQKVWNSYPYEYPRVTFEDAKLGGKLWYTAGMDSFISTMETNALMGKNVARLVVDEFVRERKGGSEAEHAKGSEERVRAKDDL